MIVRDEAAMLADCLASARPAVDRIVVVDTGSTDRSCEIARDAGAEVFKHPWQYDFAAARNAALEHVRDGYVLILDADERLTPRSCKTLRNVVRDGDLDLGLLPLHNAASLDARPQDVISGAARRGEPIALPRLLRRTPDLRFEGIVHESVRAWVAKGRRTRVVDAPIVHYGAVTELRAALGKDTRNRRLLELRCTQEPDSPTPRAYLAAELVRAGDSTAALEVAREAWAMWQASASSSPAHDPVFPASILADLELQDGDWDRAGRVVSEALAYEEHPNLWLLAGLVEERRVLEQGDGSEALHRAALHYEQCLAVGNRHFSNELMDGATSWRAATRLGTVLVQAAEPARARAAFAQALRAQPDHREASLGLAEATLSDGDPDAALVQLEPLLRLPGPDAWLIAAGAAKALGSDEDVRLLLDRARAARDAAPFLALHRDRTLAEMELGLGGVGDLKPAIEARDEVCVFAWPNWAEANDLDALFGDFGKFLSDRPALVVCLRHDPAVDGEFAHAEARLERAYAEHLGEAHNLHVVIVDQELRGDRSVANLAAPRDIALDLPLTRGVRSRFLDRLGIPRVANPAALKAALPDSV